MVEYDRIAGPYRDRNPLIRDELYDHSVMAVLGPVTGQGGIDWGCGARGLGEKLLEQGANSMLGVDISPTQIGLALIAERENPTGAEFVVGDACSFDAGRQFDFAVAVFVFHCASSHGALGQMFQNVYEHLKPGGRLVALLSYFENGSMHDKKYGYTTHYPWYMKAKNMDPILRWKRTSVRIKLYNDSGERICELQNYHWGRFVYESVARNTGFDVRWCIPGPSRKGVEDKGFNFWLDYISRPNHQIMVATKPLEAEEVE